LARTIADDVLILSGQRSFTPVYLLVSGDISEHAHAAQFAAAKAEFGALATALSIDRNCLLFVPGNHDVSWPAAKVGRDIGHPALGFVNYNSFITDLTGEDRLAVGSGYYVSQDHRFGIKFLLVNSCEKEDDLVHEGCVDETRLLRAVEEDSAQVATQHYVKVCVLHHRLDTTIADPRSRIANAANVESILAHWGCSTVLTGHVHMGLSHEVRKGDASIVYSGCGSSGVDKTQRPDGVQNQYSIHVFDRKAGSVETHWRAFNPQKRTRFGLGGWTDDLSEGSGKSEYSLPAAAVALAEVKKDVVHDRNLEARLRIRSNPFLYSNAEKINSSLILDLFVSDETRHKSAQRLTGDAIIRGPRGSGKTMFLRYLRTYGNIMLQAALRERRTAECLPVFVTLSRLHRADLGTVLDAYSAAEDLIVESVLQELDDKVEENKSLEFKAATHKMRQRFEVLSKQGSTPISNLGISIREHLGPYFRHVLLLIDELAPVFPRTFFSDPENGFVAWMNSIRNSGPFSTRITVYPNDVSDILNEERFGSIVNLEYQVRLPDEYEQFREYGKSMVSRYLHSVSIDKGNPATISDILVDSNPADPSSDALEQLIYASDGSSRRLLSLMDRCLNLRATRPHEAALTKSDVLLVIREMANNLLTGYSGTEREIAASIASACKRQSTFRFRMPNQSVMLRPLYQSREELNIIKLIEPKAGARGSVYEFAYPYCIAMDLQTHYLRDTARVCTSRDRHTGDWITKVTTIEKESLDVFSRQDRHHGVIAELDEPSVLIDGDNGQFLAERLDLAVAIGDRVTYLVNTEGSAFDLLVIAPGSG
jgi:hypothetical protein